MRAAVALMTIVAAVALDAQAPTVRPRSTTFALKHIRVVDGSGARLRPIRRSSSAKVR